MLLQNVLIQLPQMSAVHVLDGPAHLALQEDAVPVGVTVAVLPAGPLVRHQLVDQPLLLQPLQLAVYGGSVPRTDRRCGAGPPAPWPWRSRRGRRRCSPALPAAAGSYRSYASPRRFENENRFQIIAGMREMSILFAEFYASLPGGILSPQSFLLLPPAGAFLPIARSLRKRDC